MCFALWRFWFIIEAVAVVGFDFCCFQLLVCIFLDCLFGVVPLINRNWFTVATLSKDLVKHCKWLFEFSDVCIYLQCKSSLPSVCGKTSTS